MGSKGGKVSMVRTQTDRMLLFLLIAGLGSIALAQEKALDKNVKEAQNLVIKLSQKSDIDIKKSYRCGMFFPDPKDPNGLPSAPLLIFNSSWAAEECPDNPDYGKYNNFCNEIFRKFTTTLTLNDPSLKTKNREEGSTIGNDICKYVKENVKAPFVGGRKSKKFPEGLQIGMFSNSCGDNIWINAGDVNSEKLCCVVGKYVPCEDLV